MLAVNDGPTAVATVQTRMPDVVILDLGLPLTDGNDAGRSPRTGPRTHERCVVCDWNWRLAIATRDRSITGHESRITR